MFTRVDTFIENIIGLVDSSNNAILRDILENSTTIERISDLIRLAEASRPTVSRTIDIPLHSRLLPTRSYVRECIELNRYRIRRIHEVRNVSTEDIADRISYLLKHHGDGYVNTLTPEEIINANERFYVFTVFDVTTNREVVIGCIAIRVRTGEVSSLVVDRRYRRLGIAKILLNHVKNISEVPIWGYVRKNNQAMINLLTNSGYVLNPYNERSLNFSEVQNRRDS